MERKLPASIGQLLLWAPTTAYDKKHPSHQTFKNAPFFSAEASQWMHDEFMPESKDRETALASPLTYLPDEVLAKYPPTTLFLSTVDPLIDECVEFGHRLQKNGVDAAIIKADGQLHGFWLIKALRIGPTARAIMDLAEIRIKRIFASDVN